MRRLDIHKSNCMSTIKFCNFDAVFAFVSEVDVPSNRVNLDTQRTRKPSYHNLFRFVVKKSSIDVSKRVCPVDSPLNWVEGYSKRRRVQWNRQRYRIRWCLCLQWDVVAQSAATFTHQQEIIAICMKICIFLVTTWKVFGCPNPLIVVTLKASRS